MRVDFDKFWLPLEIISFKQSECFVVQALVEFPTVSLMIDTFPYVFELA